MANTDDLAAPARAKTLHVLDHLQRLGISDAQIARERATLDESRFRIAFVGEWNSGKSTLINLLLDKPVVPVGRYPETGAACYIHHEGSGRVTASWSDGRTESSEGSLGTIRGWVQITRNGTRVDVASLPHSIDIATPDIDLPDTVDLIDTPGLNDDPEMVDRALAASADADAIVFVLNTRHFLTSVEADALQALVKRRGCAGILFVLNVFLKRDNSDEWDERQNEDLPIQIAKLQALFEELGCVPAGDLLPVSAGAGSTSFGADVFRAAVKGLWSPGSREHLADMRCAAALSRALTRANDIANEGLRRVEAEYATAERARHEYEHQWAHRQNYDRFAVCAVDNAIAAWESNARMAARQIASQITTSNLKRDDTYSGSLTAALVDIGREAADKIFTGLTAISHTYRQRAPQSSEQQEIRSEFALGNVAVTVADNSIGGGGMLAGAAAGMAVGSIVPIIGTFIGAIVGGFAGAGVAAGNAMDRDVEETRARIDGAINQAVARMKERRKNLLRIVGSLQEQIAEVNRPDSTAADQWRGLVSEIGSCYSG